MQGGDLQAHYRERIVVVLEGVLCFPITEVTTTRFRKKIKVVSYSVQWYDVPLKRMAQINFQYPDLDVEIVTFKDEKLVDLAVEFFDIAHIPYSSIKAVRYNEFADTLRYQRNLRAVYDSDPERLQYYGQYGISVQPGEDW